MAHQENPPSDTDRVRSRDVSSAKRRAVRLAWEREGTPEGVGVCLSGGGIRAAAFTLGAIQALQAERGLLFGPRSAGLLAAVSGGSYTAAAHTLNAARLANGDADLPPLHPDSPEARHILANGRYLVEPNCLQATGTFMALAFVNLIAFFAFFAWIGTMTAVYGMVIADLPLRGLEETLTAPTGDRRLLLAVMAAIGSGILVRGMYKDGGARAFALTVIGFALMAAGAPALVSVLSGYEPLSDLAWWFWSPLGVSAAALAIVVAMWGLSTIIPGERSRRALRWIVSRVGIWVPRAVGFTALSLVVTGVHDRLAAGLVEDAGAALVLLFGVLVVGWLMSGAAARTSLHRENRDRISHCFAVTRIGNRVQRLSATEEMLSRLAPPEDAKRRFPRLVICATANVIWHFPGGQQRTFAPFMFSHDTCGIPGLRGAMLPTSVLEQLRAPAGVWPPRSTEPLLTLMSAVACTGAAASPSMGKYTVRQLRPVIALINLRLGRWLPNVMSERVHAGLQQSPGRRYGRHRFGAGYDEFLQELLGLHRADAERLYVSDGGHYDNTGLIALLMRRCETIWCVDSEADKSGSARQLRGVIEFALEELGIVIHLDVDQFQADDDGLLAASYAVGTIEYPEGTGTLIVIKLGLTADSPQDLLDYRGDDRGFPHHSTFRHIAFGYVRMDAYRQLGYANACAASSAIANYTN